MKKIIYERNKCIGCGTCSVICPVFWEIKEDGRAGLIGGVESKGIVEREIENESCNVEAAQSCPMQCIQISDA